MTGPLTRPRPHAPADPLFAAGTGDTVVGRDPLVEPGFRVAAWFDRWL